MKPQDQQPSTRQQSDSTTRRCGSSCTRCFAALGEALGGLSGWRLSLAAAGAFLLPVFLAMAGAVIGTLLENDNGFLAIGGGIGGFLLGSALAAAGAWWLRQKQAGRDAQQDDARIR